MKPLSWAIVGPGSIAGRFAEAVTRLPETRLTAVFGRDAKRAQDFLWRFPAAHEAHIHASLDAMLADPDVDAVYIATPHAFHAEAARACLRAGKPVLCEKPLTLDADTAAELFALSRQHNVFLMEALWTRFLPIYEQVAQWIAEDEIGPLRGLQSSFAFNIPFKPDGRHFDPGQGGGALLDVGVYCLSMSQWALRKVFGACPALESIHAVGVPAPTGVDQRISGSLCFEGDVVAQFHCGFDGHADRGLRLFGERGVISLPDRFWEATEAQLQHGRGEVTVVKREFEINGFEGQVREATRCIRAGLRESPQMPQAETLQVMQWMDRIREECGFRAPDES
jgi:predicted dehydrogenase